jgi:AmpE protein
MTLMVIVICLLSERFLVHSGADKRYHLFFLYGQFIERKLPGFLLFPWLILFFSALPILLVVFFVLNQFQNSWFGFIGFLMNVGLFYFCIGPGNPFYPSLSKTTTSNAADDVGPYFSQINGQLFAVMFWYIVLGPLMALLYRIISQARYHESTKQLASWITNALDWLPARMTVLLLMLVGNFQAVRHDFLKLFFKNPIENESVLSDCGVLALSSVEDDAATILQAESLVEHAIIVLLVLLAGFTLVAWL